MLDYSARIKNIFNVEINSAINVMDSLDESINEFVEELSNCKGSIVFTGIGKSGHICKKIVATMQSLGIHSMYLHPSEAMHGDLGILSRNDIIVAVSNSGETKEVLDIVPSIDTIGSRLFCIVGRHKSSLESVSECVIVMDGIKEAYLEGMVPTSSTTATLMLGDAIAIAIAEQKGFNKNKFSVFHPNGQLGKRMTLKVSDIMIKGTEIPMVLSDSDLKQVIFEMCRKPVGGVCVVNHDNKLQGVMTDGDLRRILNNEHSDIGKIPVNTIMSKLPVTVDGEMLAYDMILNIVSKHEFSFYPVVDSEFTVIGVLRMIDLVKSGLR